MDFVAGSGHVGGAYIGSSNFGGHHSLAGSASSAIHTSSAASSSGLAGENGPILYSEPNRTSAIDDIRSVVLYIFIITIFLSFFLILPGIRNEKFPTFLCITTSLFVTSIILLSLFGTTWHVGEAPISAAYKAFSRDRIQGELRVRIGLQSVNITLRAQKYYILDATDGPVVMDNMHSSPASLVAAAVPPEARGSDAASLDAELEAEEAFAHEDSSQDRRSAGTSRRGRSAKLTNITRATSSAGSTDKTSDTNLNLIDKPGLSTARITSTGQKYTIKRVNVDINYNERFYWIGPNQMRREYHSALERGLPFPILTVVEYLSQDDGGFSWSRQYRLAGYYTNICLWLSVCACVLMFVLHCAAPKYGIYMMQILGCMLLFTDFIYASLVPRGDKKLVIPFEGQSLTFAFGWNFWIVLIGGCVSLLVGSVIVLVDFMYPNYIFTTVLDVDFDQNYYRRKKQLNKSKLNSHKRADVLGGDGALERPVKPPFYGDGSRTPASSQANSRPSISSSSSVISSGDAESEITNPSERLRSRHQVLANRDSITSSSSSTSSLSALRDSRDTYSSFGRPDVDHRLQDERIITTTIESETGGDSESYAARTHSNMSANPMGSPATTQSGDQISDNSTLPKQHNRTLGPRHDNLSNQLKSNHQRQQQQQQQRLRANHYGRSQATGKKSGFKETDHQTHKLSRSSSGGRQSSVDDVRL